MICLSEDMEKVIIVGSGMAGLSAGLYAGRYELSPLIIGETFGGATSLAWTIENYPGFKKIDGFDLMMKVREQVESLGGKIKDGRVDRIKKTSTGFSLSCQDGTVLETESVILAVGTARRKLNLPREEEFSKGKGIHYCITCDGPLYKNKTIAVVGGGDAAVKSLLLAVQYASKIFQIFLGKGITAEPVNYSRLQPFIGKQIELIPETTITSLEGDQRLSAIKLSNGRELKIDGLFVEIGALPNVKLVEPLGVALDEKGYLQVDNQMATSVAGLFAAGDATNFFGSFKQDITAAAMGAVAATSAFRYLQSKSSTD